MPSTEITRVQYQHRGLRYANDMTDAEWALIERHYLRGAGWAGRKSLSAQCR